MNEEILLRQNENGEFESYEPYATIEIDTEEDFDKIKSAIDKQKPMKPAEADDREGCVTWMCPACERVHFTEWKTNYCSECGQKIDWTEGEE